MYSIFDKILQTDKGKTFFYTYESDYNVQLVYIKLSEHCTKSFKASLDASNLLSYITSAHIDLSI